MKKSFRNIALSALITIGGFSAITYTSCNKDECKDVVCNNGGTCVSGNCSCPSGYEGNNCDTKSRDRFLNSGSSASFLTGVGQDGCYNAGYTMTANPGSNNDEVIIGNFGGYGSAASVVGKVNNMTFTQSGTTTAGAVTISGVTGTISSDGRTFIYTYHAVDATTNITCSGTSTKL